MGGESEQNWAVTGFVKCRAKASVASRELSQVPSTYNRIRVELFFLNVDTFPEFRRWHFCILVNRLQPGKPVGFDCSFSKFMVILKLTVKSLFQIFYWNYSSYVYSTLRRQRTKKGKSVHITRPTDAHVSLRKHVGEHDVHLLVLLGELKYPF